MLLGAGFIFSVSGLSFRVLVVLLIFSSASVTSVHPLPESTAEHHRGRALATFNFNEYLSIYRERFFGKGSGKMMGKWTIGLASHR